VFFETSCVFSVIFFSPYGRSSNALSRMYLVPPVWIIPLFIFGLLPPSICPSRPYLSFSWPCNRNPEIVRYLIFFSVSFFTPSRRGPCLNIDTSWPFPPPVRVQTIFSRLSGRSRDFFPCDPFFFSQFCPFLRRALPPFRPLDDSRGDSVYWQHPSFFSPRSIFFPVRSSLRAFFF